jgi:hydroxymethylpyrimidine pyrophosphatase-like HAD family hydrolase
VLTGRKWPEMVLDDLRHCGRNVPLPDFICAAERELHEFDGGRYLPDSTWNQRCRTDLQTFFDAAKPSINRIRKWIDSRTLAWWYDDFWSPLNIVADNAHEGEQVYKYLQLECRNLPELSFERNQEFFRVGCRRYSKGVAVTEITRRLGLDCSSVFVAGDHFNDLTMMDRRCADMVAAPSNAIPEVKAAVQRVGGYVASTPCGHGTLEALIHFSTWTDVGRRGKHLVQEKVIQLPAT